MKAWLVILVLVGFAIMVLLAVGLVAAATFVSEALSVPPALAFLGVMAAAGALFFLIGAVLPKRHEWHASIQLRHPRATVWQLLIDDGGVPAFPALGSVVERLPDNQGRPVWRVTYKHGEQRVYEATEAVAPRRLAIDLDRNESSWGSGAQAGPVSGEVQWDLEECEGGSRVIATLSLEIGKGLQRPFVYLYILLAWRFHTRGLRQNLKFLATQLGE
jgi:hypothetical protein